MAPFVARMTELSNSQVAVSLRGRIHAHPSPGTAWSRTDPYFREARLYAHVDSPAAM